MYNERKDYFLIIVNEVIGQRKFPEVLIYRDPYHLIINSKIEVNKLTLLQ